MLGEYVSVYEEQIAEFDAQIAGSQDEKDLLTEELRLRKEQEDAIAAEKAKKAEFDDMRAALDEAKGLQD